MLKKNIISWIFGLLFTAFFFNFVSGQEIITGQEFSIWKFDWKFCNGWILSNDLAIITDSAKNNEICVSLTNKYGTEIMVNMWFVDGELTNDQFRLKACKNEWKIQNFAQYIVWEQWSFLIPWSGVITKTYNIVFPAWFSWVVHGCLVYYLSNSTQTLGGLRILTRKTNFIDAIVWWVFQRSVKFLPFQWEFPPSKIKVYKKNNEIFIQAHLINTWDVDEDLILSWILLNKLWYHKSFLFSKTLRSNWDIIISWSLWKLPFYKWFYKIQLKWEAQAKIAFSKDALPDKLKLPMVISEQKIVFFMPRVIILIVIGTIIIIFVIYNKPRSRFWK